MKYQLLGSWQAWSGASCTSISIEELVDCLYLLRSQVTNLDRVIGLERLAGGIRIKLPTHVLIRHVGVV
jgi:hypothetical protein